MLVFGPPGPPPPPLERMSWLATAQAALTGVRLPRPVNLLTPASRGLAFETQWIPLPDGQQLEAWFIPHAQPRGLAVLFHGYAASKESLLAPAAQFAELGYAALVVDFQGAGGSPGAGATLGIREAGDVAATLRYARGRWPNQRLVGYGFSMGAAALLRAGAVEGEQPDALILEAPFDRLLGSIRTRFDALGLPSFPVAELLLFWGSVQLGANGFDHNPATYAQSISSPALVIHGAADPRVPAGQAAAVADSLGGPARLVTIPGVGHETGSAAAPERWAEAVGDFLAEESGPGR